MLLGHGARSRNFPGVHQRGRSEIALGKGLGNRLQMFSDGLHPGAVRPVPLQLDPPAVGQIFEAMGGGVLVHSHGHPAAGLHRR